MPHEEHPHHTNPVLLMEWLDLPIHVGCWVLEESSYVFESSPFLGHVSGLSSSLNKLREIPISFLGQGSKING